LKGQIRMDSSGL